MSLYFPIHESNGLQWEHQPDLTPLYLPDHNGHLRFLGLVQDHVVDSIDWHKYGFRLVTPQDGVHVPWEQDGLGEDEQNPRKRIVPTLMLSEGIFGGHRAKWTSKEISDNLLAIIEDPNHRKNIPSLQRWVIKKDPHEKEYACVVAGHEHLKIPDYLSVHLGLVTAGVHLNIYTRDSDGNIDKIWVQIRSAKVSSYPNKLDQAVAGGVHHGETFRQALVREAEEETGNQDLVRLVKSKVELDGYFTFFTRRKENSGTLKGLIEPGIRACYSLEVKDDFKLLPGKDEEVEGFRLLPVAQVEDAIRKMEFKPNCALAMLKFFLVHGIFTKENERQYWDVVEGLEVPLPYPVLPLGRLTLKKTLTMDNLYEGVAHEYQREYDSLAVLAERHYLGWTYEEDNSMCD